MTKSFVICLGFILSKTPFKALEFLTEVLALFFLILPSKRKKILFSNLTHSFPNWSQQKINSVARESTARMFEMGFFSLCYPFFSKDERRRCLFIDREVEKKLLQLNESLKPVLFLAPHCCLFETMAVSPLFRPSGRRNLGAIYRPNKNKTLDKWITCARKEVGIKTFSRKRGLIEARSHLKKGNWLGLLYDQNAGERGFGSIFLGRICSFSPLPDLLAKNEDVICVHAIAKRQSFFRSRLELDEIRNQTKNVSQSAHEFLCNEIQFSERGFPEWLWSHGKWKTNNMSHEIFFLQDKFQNLDFRKPNRQSTQIFIRMPNWLGDVVMALPVIRAIRRGRPDVRISLFCKSIYVNLLKSLIVADIVHPLPQSSGLKYFHDVSNLNLGPCDAMLVLTNSWRGDFESLLFHAEFRIGIEIKGRRPLLNYALKASGFRENEHQVTMWFRMLAKYSQHSPPLINFFDAPFCEVDFSSSAVLIAPGSLNDPKKRLPIKNWVEISKIILRNNPNVSFKIIGTSTESMICNELYGHLESVGIISSNLCGKTNLVELSEIIKKSKCLFCNDSGAMHLANAIGLPVFAIFGSTSPQKTGPVFDIQMKLFQFKESKFDKISKYDEDYLTSEIKLFLNEIEKQLAS